MQSAFPFVEVELDKIRPPSDQHRESINPERLGALADSIAAEGLHQPVGARGPMPDGTFEIVWGHRRYLAVRSLRWLTIPCRIFPADYDPLLARGSENLQREQLNPVEEAHVVRLYQERGVARAEIARLCRRSVGWVDQRARLLNLPADVLDAIREHGMSLAVAEQLADIDHEPYRRSLLYEAVQHGATASVAALWRQHYLSDRDRIVTNTIKVDQLIADREKYRLLYPCDWCGDAVAYEATRTVRLCVPCDGQLQAAKEPPSA